MSEFVDDLLNGQYSLVHCKVANIDLSHDRIIVEVINPFSQNHEPNISVIKGVVAHVENV